MPLRATLAVLLLTTSAAASAHITFAEPKAAAGSYYAGFLRVTHGCGASPTTSIRVEIPAGVDIARPQPKPGWTLVMEHGPLAMPVPSESGSVAAERVTAITWTGTLPADEFDQFGIMLKLPAQAGSLYFPTVQRCTVGTNAWLDRPATPDDWHKAKMPAPMLIVTDAGAPTMDHMDMSHP